MKTEDMSECPECLQAASKQELEAFGGICKDCWHEIYEYGKDND